MFSLKKKTKREIGLSVESFRNSAEGSRNRRGGAFASDKGRDAYDFDLA